MDKVLLIRSNETEAYKQLGYWNIDKVSSLKDLKYIFVHNGNGAVTGAYEVLYTKNGFTTEKPYSVISGTVEKKDEDGTVRTIKNVRVNFYEFVKPLNVKFYSVVVPATKQGEASPVRVAQFDKKTMTVSY